MFQCTRRSLSQKLPQPTPVSADPILRSPLLFLYPRWFRNAAGPDNNGEEKRKLRIIRYEPTTQRSPEKIDHQNEADPSPNLYYYKYAPSFPRLVVTQHPAVSPARPDTTDIIQQRYERLPRSRSRYDPNSGKKDPSFQSARSNASIFAENEHHVIARKMRTKDLFRHGNIDWLPAAEMLSQFPTSSGNITGKEIQLRTEFLKAYTGCTGPNMWIHRAGSGCEVHVLTTSTSDPDKRRIVLKGSQRAQELTENYLLHLQDLQHTSLETGKLLENPQVPDLKSLSSATTSLTPVPFSWTVRSFHDQIRSITNHKIPRLIQKEYSNETYNKSIAALLAQYFSDPASSAYASAAAFNKAFTFLSKHTELLTTMELLRSRAKHLGIMLDVGSYNLLLLANFKVNNKVQVSSILHEMYQARIPPNGSSWAALLSAVSNNQAQRGLLARMRAKGLLDGSETVAALVRCVIDSKVPPSKPAIPFPEFVQQLDESFGPDWLTSKACNRIIHYYSKRNLWRWATDALQLFADRGGSLDKQSLMYLMSLNRRKGSLHDCVRLLRAATTQGNFDYNAILVAHTFTAAWNRRRYNLCRCLWRYAASHGIITYNMQNVVISSLLKNTQKSQTESETWRRRAGKVIAGTDLDNMESEINFPRLSQYSLSDDPMEWLAHYTPDDGTRDEQISLAFVIIHRDLTAWKYFEPMDPIIFTKALGRANDLDIRWMSDESIKSASLPTLIQRALQVPLVPRPEPDEYAEPGTRDTEALTKLDVNAILKQQEDFEAKQEAEEAFSTDTDEDTETRLFARA